MSDKNKTTEEIEVINKTKLAESLKKQLKALAEEYNRTTDDCVGIIFSGENLDYDYNSGYNYQGWMPSSLDC